MKVWESDANDDEPENVRVERLDGQSGEQQSESDATRTAGAGYSITK